MIVFEDGARVGCVPVNPAHGIGHGEDALGVGVDDYHWVKRFGCSFEHGCGRETSFLS